VASTFFVLCTFDALAVRTVGQDNVEEVNVVPYGNDLDFGWSVWEGDRCTKYDCKCSVVTLVSVSVKITCS